MHFFKSCSKYCNQFLSIIIWDELLCFVNLMKYSISIEKAQRHGRHVNFSFSCGKPFVPTYSHIPRPCLPQEQPAKSGSHSYEWEESICTNSKTQTYKKVASKFFEKGHKDAQSLRSQVSCSISLIDGWNSGGREMTFSLDINWKVGETLNTSASLSRCFLSIPQGQMLSFPDPFCHVPAPAGVTWLKLLRTRALLREFSP